jgi:DNA modification methylase
VERQSVSLAKNQIHQGDCVNLLRQLDGGSVDLVFADPPFNIGYEYDQYDDERESGDYLQWCGEWIREIHRVLKPSGTYWLAIGDEYAAELKIASQKAGFHCRSWVIWYYTFGVNCVNGFSRSHTHLFHFVKDPKKFTFNRLNPQIRVKSARELVYADNRANPNGRLPDNTWIIRPQDAPLSFSPNHDTWYFARVAGTFKEREGFHGCQMPEQLLARIIRTSSRPQELVLDPFGGSGTTLCVSKKLGRQWMGCELSSEYVKYIDERLARTRAGDPVDGPEDPIQSAPVTAAGKRRKKPFDEQTERVVREVYEKTADGYPPDYVLCDKELDEAFVSGCLARGLGGSAYTWNRYLLQLRKAKKLPESTRAPERISSQQMNRYGYASEVAWRLLSIDYRKTLDDILCSPDFAAEFDRLAAEFGPQDKPATPCEYRRAALAIRKQAKPARETAAGNYDEWMRAKHRRILLDANVDFRLAVPGAFVLCQKDSAIFASASGNIRDQLTTILQNPNWQKLDPDSVIYMDCREDAKMLSAVKAAFVRKENPLLNCRLWVAGSELMAGNVA